MQLLLGMNMPVVEILVLMFGGIVEWHRYSRPWVCRTQHCHYTVSVLSCARKAR